jgi:hypothetical protein
MILTPRPRCTRSSPSWMQDTVRSFTDEQVLNEFGKAMVAHSYGY